MIDITPTDLVNKHGLAPPELHRLRKMASAPSRKCDNCDNLAWKYGGRNEMCFSCTTGESDSSNDYELIPERYT